jgi:hypothetical protein
MKEPPSGKSMTTQLAVITMAMPSEPSPRTLPETLVGVDEEQSRPDIIQPAPLSAPQWAPNVVVVNEHMPQGGLSWSQWTLSDLEEERRGEDRARKTLQTQ